MTLHLALTFLAYVALGVIADILIGKYYLALSERRAFLASVLAMVIPLMTFLVMERALTTRSLVSIVGFVVGNGIGTFWVVKHG